MSAELAPERWSRLWELFDAARERPAGAERARFVAETSAGDAELGAELAELLAASDTAGALLDRGDRDWVAPLLDGGSEPAALGAGAAVGAWRLGALLGEGGMGSVFEAERSEGGFRQRAAVKLLRGGGLSPLLRERFLQERRILARLEHPGIARFLDGGVTADGVPWFALERVEGEPITSWCRQHLARVERRVDLLLEVCEAAAFAHRNLVVHRDLKPSNILVDGEGRVKLLDFGIAKLLAPGGEDAAPEQRTVLGALTPEYAAPEQRAGGAVTTATDVWALGMILFELLAGRLPAAPDAGVERPSAAARADASRPEGAGLPRRLRGDLDRIVGRALAPEPDRRYASAEALADDLRRHLDGRPVRARGDSLGYRVGKFVGRHRWAMAAAGAALLALVGGFGAALWQAREAADAAARERDARARAESALSFLTSLFGSSDPAAARGRVFTDREMLREGAERLERELAGRPELQAPLWQVIASVHLQRGEYAEGEPLARRLLAAESRRHGPASLPAARARQLLAEYLFYGDRFGASLLQYRASAAAHERDDATREDAYLEALTGIAACVRELGDLAEAERYLRRALALARDLHGEASAQYAGVANSLVNAMSGRDAEQLEFARAAVAGFRAARGEEHPDTLISALNLTIIEWNLGHGREARAILAPVVPAITRILGADHLQTVIARRLVAGFAEEDADFARATAEIDAALDSLARGFGADSRGHAYAAIQAAHIARHAGDLALADRRGRAAWEHFHTTEPNHSNAAWAAAALARALVASGDLGEAGELVRRALAIDERAGATESTFHADVLDAAAELALARGAPADRAEARRCFEASLALRRRFSPDGSRATAFALHGLADALAGDERATRCRPLLAEAVAIYGRVLAPSHPERRAAERDLAACPPAADP